MRQTHRLLAACTALMAVCACSRDTGAPAPEPAKAEADQAKAEPTPSPPAAPDQEAAAKAEPKVATSGRRCGWLHNPTPANWWLIDGDGQWVLGSQGAEQVAGMDEMPDMSAVEWVETNGHYGYGCACMDIVVDPFSGDVLRISKASPKPLAQCRRDRNLPNPDEG